MPIQGTVSDLHVILSVLQEPGNIISDSVH